ncbi:MAG: CvpA family protein [Candidatus Eisenbacteria bacterium]|nr:CvpA family protein [Candidatus Eisenbacteria bacterium]
MVGVTDLGLVILVVLSLVAGFRNGFVESLFSLAAWLGGVLLGVHLAHPVLSRLPATIQRVPGVVIVTGVLVGLLAFALLRLLGAAAGGQGGKDRGAGDRWLGGLLGLARGLFLSAAIASFLVAYLPPEGKLMRETRVIPLLGPAGAVVSGLAPAPLRLKMEQGWIRVMERRATDEEAIPT